MIEAILIPILLEERDRFLEFFPLSSGGRIPQGLETPLIIGQARSRRACSLELVSDEFVHYCFKLRCVFAHGPARFCAGSQSQLRPWLAFGYNLGPESCLPSVHGNDPEQACV